MNQATKPQILCEGSFVRLVRRGTWEWAERTNSSGVVVVVAVTEDGRLLLTEQYRTPLDARVVDLPAGLAGDVAGAEQEDLAEAARRELLEETGCRALDFQYLVEGPTSAGMTSEIVTMFLARDARRVGPGGGEGSERIQVHAVPLAEVRAWLEQRQKREVLIDPKIYAALYLLEHRGGIPAD